ncbi:hypothetical protein H0H92_003070 [Tricholoma furcatifolium]|nr:hypothetical protein H0H92_003070 [Tricholoma furcatifolium]
MAIHEVIRRALGLSADGACTGQSRVKTNIILDAEMVAFHGDKVDEFWRIKGLIENTAIGARARSRKNHPVEESQVESEAYGSYDIVFVYLAHLPTRCSQLSMATTVSDPQLRLGLIFFDILFLNSQSLLMTPYRRRREILESLIHLLPGECLLAERFLVGVTSGAGSKVEDSFVESLDRVFSHSIATHQEGLMLKGDETFYHDFSTPWVKLKKDYIPGYGDTIDMAVVGVAWERERGRVLRVPPSTMTTFYIGAVENPEEIRRDLEEINFLIRSSETVPYNSPTGIKRLGYTFTLLSSLPEPPFLLKIPLLAELYGAGFTKSPGSRHYELRFPRTTKIHRPSDRPWTEGINLKELHKVACMSVGRDSSSKEARDMTAAMWGITPSPGVNCSVKRKRRENTYREKLAELDGRTWNPERGQSLGELSPLAKKRRLGETVTASEAQVMVPSQSSRTPSDSVAHVQPLATSQKPNFVALDHTLCQNHGNEARGSLKLAIPMPCSPPSTPQKRRPQMQRSSTAQPSLRVASPCMKGNVAESVGGSNAQFVENALVWFAKPRGKSWKVKNTVPREQRIHSVEALMTGCGWYEGRPAASWVEKGAIFVDNTCKVGQNMASPALEMLKEHMRVLPRNEGRKPIWLGA